MTNPVGLKLNYLDLTPHREEADMFDTQPVLVKLVGNKTLTKLVPVLPLTEIDKCIGCIAENTFGQPNPRIDCFDLPKCDGAIFVRATPTTLLRHIAWRLEKDK